VRRAVIDPVLNAGYEVLALDLRGWGESRPVANVKVNFDWQDFFAYRSLEIGRPLLGQRVKDLVAINPNRTHRRSWTLGRSRPRSRAGRPRTPPPSTPAWSG
jgi:pimeloyl-ACP methyl ester carboxylesterase